MNQAQNCADVALHFEKTATALNNIKGLQPPRRVYCSSRVRLYVRFTLSYRDVESVGSMCPTKRCGDGS